MKNLLTIGAIALGIAAILAFAFWRMRANQQEQDAIAARVIQPWLQHMKARSFAEARDTLTTERYREHISAAQLADAWEELQRQDGPLQRWEIRRSEEITEIGRGSFQRFTCDLIFEKATRTIVYETRAVDPAKGPQLDKAYRWRVGALEPAVL